MLQQVAEGEKSQESAHPGCNDGDKKDHNHLDDVALTPMEVAGEKSHDSKDHCQRYRQQCNLGPVPPEQGTAATATTNKKVYGSGFRV